MRLRKIVLKNDVASSKNVNLYQFFQKFRLKFCPNYSIFVWLSWKIRLVKAKNVFKNVLKFLYFAVFNRVYENIPEENVLKVVIFSIQNLLPLPLNRQPRGRTFCQNIKN